MLWLVSHLWLIVPVNSWKNRASSEHYYYIKAIDHNFVCFIGMILQQIFSQVHTNVCEHFLKMYEDYCKFTKTFQEDPKMLWSYTNNFKYSFRAKYDISEVISSLVRIYTENTPPSLGHVLVQMFWAVYFYYGFRLIMTPLFRD